MLASCGSDSYLYDMDGVRQEKTVNGVTHTYYTDGTKIIAEKVGDKVFEYYYDAQGVIGFKYDGNVYYYKKNLLGDIDRIYDANKNLVAEYKYDAWGNHRIYISGGIDITENMSYKSSVAKLNPFRYRGYYYDAETGLYYLNSRYYDPSIGRFINADDISYIQPTDINGLNLFAYCGNNPVMYTDPEGTWSWSSFWRGVVNVLTGVGAIVAGALVIASGVAGVGMLVVAGVTITAGALTTINGGADIGEAISGYNFVRDGIFGGNQSAYNLYSGITAGVAAVGSAICGGWLRYNAPRINAYKKMGSYNVKGKHLPNSNGNWAKFSTGDQEYLRKLGREAIRKTPMKKLISNSPDSYKIFYDAGIIIGSKGETSVRLVFSRLGKIITFFPG